MASPDPSWSYGNAAQWVAAIATLLAVIVALFKEDIIRRFRRPILRISIKPGPPDCHKTWITYQTQGTALTLVRTHRYYLRLWLKNEGAVRAEKVQVFAEKLWRRAADGSFNDVESFLPMNLRWSHSRTPDSPEIFADGISPRMGKHCDLGHITHPKRAAELNEWLSDVPHDKTILALDLEVAPNTQSHLLPPGVYRLDLRIAAANSKPVETTLEITLTGEWHDRESTMLTDGIGVRLVN